MINEMLLKTSEVFMDFINNDTKDLGKINDLIGHIEKLRITPNNCVNFSLYKGVKHPLTENTLNLYESGKIIVFHDNSTPTSGYLPIIPLKLSGKPAILINATNFAKKIEDIDSDGKPFFSYRFKSEAVFAELLHMATTVYELAFTSGKLISGIRCRESLIDLYTSMLMHALTRCTALATSPRAKYTLKFLTTKFIMSRFGVEWDKNYGRKLSEVTETEMNVLDIKYDSKDYLMFSSFVDNILKIEYPHLKNVTVRTLIKMYSMSFGVQGVLCLDYIPYVCMLAISANNYYTYENTNIKVSVGKECTYLYSELVPIIR